MRRTLAESLFHHGRNGGCAANHPLRSLSVEPRTTTKLPQRETKQRTQSNSVKEAERVVGYSTSFLNLRWLLNDEVANTAMYMKKLTGTEHPLLKVAKDVLFKTHTPSWGLIVLLLSKAGGLKKEFSAIDQDITAGILHSQRVLAEVTEMVRTSYLIHNGVITVDNDSINADVLNYGNKIALLSGDYLLSKSFNDLSNLRNQTVNEIISSAIRDFSESLFLSYGDYDYPMAHKPKIAPKTKYCEEFTSSLVDYGPYKVDEILGHPREEWVLRNVLASGNLLGKSCRAALLIAGHDMEAQESGYLFGKHLSLAWQANIDLDNFKEGKVDFISAPVMLTLEENPEIYEDFQRSIVTNDLNFVIKIISESNALEKTVELQEEYTNRALENLEYFECNSATNSLRHLIDVI